MLELGLSELEKQLRSSGMISEVCVMLKSRSDWDSFLGDSSAAASAHLGLLETLQKSSAECLTNLADGVKLGILALQQLAKLL